MAPLNPKEFFDNPKNPRLKEFLSKNKQVFVFCPTIAMCKKVYFFLSLVFKNGNCVHSKNVNRQIIINDFKNRKYKYLVTTAVLERGVTVKDLQVIVFEADHKIYNRYSLIQIAGRAGRKKESPEGSVIFLAKKDSKEIEECIREISKSNTFL